MASSTRGPRRQWLIWLVVALVGLGLWAPLGSWGGTGSAGTVPRTPPPTWTPRPRTATPRPTAPQPPPTAPAATPVPQPDAWLGLHATYEVLAPGQVVTVELTLHNGGGAPLPGAVVTLPWPTTWALVGWRADQGAATLAGSELSWRPDDLGAGQTSRLYLTAEVTEDLLPGTHLDLMASVTWASEARESNRLSLVAPRALLPATGGG